MLNLDYWVRIVCFHSLKATIYCIMLQLPGTTAQCSCGDNPPHFRLWLRM